MVELTKMQDYALKQMLDGKNVFLTGYAGTGKSFLLKEFLKHCEKKNVLLCAPTGLAALNIGGTTLHRAFNAPVGVCLDPPKECPKLIKKVDILIIDEISMCRIDLFDYVMKCIDMSDKNIQIIFVGDFFQLPPVITDNQAAVLKSIYGKDVKGGYAFQSQKWKNYNIEIIALNEVIRQDDKKFIEILNEIREGKSKHITYINKNSSKKSLENAIYVCGTNAKVKKINEEELDNLEGDEEVYYSRCIGEVKASDKPTDDILRLKIGARVMTILNDTEFGEYMNGTMGTVVHLGDDSIDVEIDDTGNVVTIEMKSWSIQKYVLEDNKFKKKEIGRFLQIPVKLAYAITIHKSQGQTFHSMNLYPFSWDHGQLYVALSRCQSLRTLHLENKIMKRYLKVDEEVQKFYAEKENYNFFGGNN